MEEFSDKQNLYEVSEMQDYSKKEQTDDCNDGLSSFSTIDQQTTPMRYHVRQTLILLLVVVLMSL